MPMTVLSQDKCNFQATFLNKKLNINGKRINLSIWDTAGQEKFHALGPIYYRNSNGAILVYDITDEDSFIKVISINSANVSAYLYIYNSCACVLLCMSQTPK